jgi:hypothetical protein
MSLLTKPDGSAFDSNGLGIWFAEAIEDAGLPDACVLHGLRKTAARMLAEAGCITRSHPSPFTGRSRRSSATPEQPIRSGWRQRRYIGRNGTETEPRPPNHPNRTSAKRKPRR